MGGSWRERGAREMKREERESPHPPSKKNKTDAPSGPTKERSTLPPLADFFWLMDPPKVSQAVRALAETDSSAMAERRGRKKRKKKRRGSQFKRAEPLLLLRARSVACGVRGGARLRLLGRSERRLGSRPSG